MNLVPSAPHIAPVTSRNGGKKQASSDCHTTQALYMRNMSVWSLQKIFQSQVHVTELNEA